MAKKKEEVVSARTMRRAINELERSIEVHTGGISQEMGLRIDAAHGAVNALQLELRAALDRKPNAVLQQWVYQLRATRAELALVQETLEKNTAVLQRFVELMERAPRLEISGSVADLLREG